MNFIKHYGRCVYAKIVSELNQESISESDKNSTKESKD